MISDFDVIQNYILGCIKENLHDGYFLFQRVYLMAMSGILSSYIQNG